MRATPVCPAKGVLTLSTLGGRPAVRLASCSFPLTLLLMAVHASGPPGVHDLRGSRVRGSVLVSLAMVPSGAVTRVDEACVPIAGRSGLRGPILATSMPRAGASDMTRCQLKLGSPAWPGPGNVEGSRI